MKKLFLPFLMTILASASFFSNPLVAACPIFDLHSAVDLARNVRFDELKISKSGQFSERGFIELVKQEFLTNLIMDAE